MRARVRRIEADCALEQRHGAIERLESLDAAIEEPPRERLVRIDHGCLGRRARIGHARGAQPAGQLLHQPILQIENLGQRPIHFGRPNQLTAVHVGERCRDANGIAGPLKCAAHQPARSQFARRRQEQRAAALARLPSDCFQNFRNPFARDDRDAIELNGAGGERLGEPCAEPVVVRAARNVHKPGDGHGYGLVGIDRIRDPRAGAHRGQCAADLLEVGESLLWIAREHPAHDPLQLRQSGIALDVREWRHFVAENALEDLRDGASAERRPAARQLVQHDAEREHVGPPVDVAPGRLLGRHIRKRADEPACRVREVDASSDVVRRGQ